MGIRLKIILFVVTVSLQWAGLAAAGELPEQRAAFSRALRAAESGDWQAAAAELPALAGYPLVDDLEGAWLLAQADNVEHARIAEYLAQHPDLYASSRLRIRWLHRLASEGRWNDFLTVYQAGMGRGSNAALDCLALAARMQDPDKTDLSASYRVLWLVGHSQAKECDGPFEALLADGRIGSDLVRQRMRLALNARDFRLAAYLAQRLAEADPALVDLYREMDSQPERELAQQRFRDTEMAREIITHGLLRLARRDPDQSQELWRNRFQGRFAFSALQEASIRREIALWSGRKGLPDGIPRLASLSAGEHSQDSLEWWLRAGLRAGDWKSVAQAVAAMPDAMASEPAWQYWLARAMIENGEQEISGQILLALSQLRNYYGFLAADAMDVPYSYGHSNLPPDETLIASLSQRSDLLRAREWFAVGMHSRGCLEWDRAVAALPAAQQGQASLLAHRWGWHSRAIVTAARQGLFGDLEIRYPPAYLEWFNHYSQQAGIGVGWAMGIARSESLFMPDARSPAGALGLMQLMPGTGAQAAHEIKLGYQGQISLLDPETNISLGTHYLSKMQQRFASHRVLATAAYNAGPNRVETWLPQDTDMQADVWLETVPYKETRTYVRRVLESETIFGWRLLEQPIRLSQVMAPVPAAGKLPALRSALPQD